MTPLQNHPSRRQGLTLVELLVTIGIIGLLVAILLPTLARARGNAYQARCASNLRQLGQGITLYAQAHGMRFPLTQHDADVAPEEAWVFNLMPYLENVDEIRLCPEHARQDDVIPQRGSSFVFNEYVVEPLFHPSGRVLEDFTRLTRLKQPARVPLLFELADSEKVLKEEQITYWDHTHTRDWFATADAALRWKRMTNEIATQRHGGGVEIPAYPAAEWGSAEAFLGAVQPRGKSNVLYADMRVESHDAGQFKQWAVEGTSESNFARPVR